MTLTRHDIPGLGMSGAELQVHEDQLLEKGHPILFRKEAAAIPFKNRTTPLPLGRDTGLMLGGVTVRVGDLVVVHWGRLISGAQLALVTGQGSRGRIRIRKWRGTGGWTKDSGTVAADRIMDRPDEKRLRKAEKGGAFLDPALQLMRKDQVQALMQAAAVINVPLGVIQYGNPKSGKSMPLYLLGDRVLGADGKLRDR